MNKVIVITGPTAVGKTKLSIEIAKKYHGEIINADAVQVYKGLDIGSAKVTEEEKENIPHHLFDIKEVDEEYTIYHYQQDARKIIEDIQKRGKTPILVGGTGLYIKSALYDYKLSEEKEAKMYEDLTTEELYNNLLKVDKDIIDKFGEYVLPARYFGNVNSGATKGAKGVRSLIEQTLTGTDDKSYHVFAGQLIPTVCTASAGTSYTVDSSILFKVFHKKSVPYMSCFEVGSSFFNAGSLTNTNFLTWGHNTLTYLKNYPCITVKKA